MCRLFKLFILMMPILMVSCSEAEEITTNQYRLTFDGASDRQIEIEAVVKMTGNTLIVDDNEIWYIPGTESWWQGITIESVEDLAGNALEVGSQEGISLTIVGASNQFIRVNYTVDISFIDERLPYGNTAAGVSFANGAFTVTRPLFISGQDFPGANIVIEKPDGLHFDAPWDVEGEGFYVSSFDHLIRAVISFGDYQILSEPQGNLDYRLIVFGLDPEASNIFKQTMAKVSKYYVENYSMPFAGRYIQVVYAGYYLGGEAYPKSSVSSVIPEKIDEGVWKLTLAHELFHTWNPFLIPGTQRQEMEWFKEGFTNYLTGRALVETGEITASNWQAHSKNQYLQYVEKLATTPDNITIATSGVDKDEYGVLVYDGGAALAAWLDQELTRVSDGELDLQDFVAGLIKKGATDKSYLGIQSFLAAVASVDPAVAEELEIYLTTKAPVPLPG